MAGDTMVALGVIWGWVWPGHSTVALGQDTDSEYSNGCAGGHRGGPVVTSRPWAGVGRDGAHGPEPGGREQPLQPEPPLLRRLLRAGQRRRREGLRLERCPGKGTAGDAGTGATPSPALTSPSAGRKANEQERQAALKVAEEVIARMGYSPRTQVGAGGQGCPRGVAWAMSPSPPCPCPGRWKSCPRAARRPSSSSSSPTGSEGVGGHGASAEPGVSPGLCRPCQLPANTCALSP